MLTVNIWNKQPVSLLFIIFRRKLIILNYAFKYILDSSDRYLYDRTILRTCSSWYMSVKKPMFNCLMCNQFETNKLIVYPHMVPEQLCDW